MNNFDSGMAAFEDPPTYYLGRNTAFRSVDWCGVELHWPYDRVSPETLMKKAKIELTAFGVRDLSVIEGVKLRQILLECLDQYAQESKLKAEGKLRGGSLIEPVRESAMRWVHQLYRDDFFALEIPKWFMTGHFHHPEFKTFCDDLEYLRATAHNL